MARSGQTKRKSVLPSPSGAAAVLESLELAITAVWDEAAGPEASDAELDRAARMCTTDGGRPVDDELAPRWVESAKKFRETPNQQALMVPLPPRRALEAALAAHHGVPEAEYKTANASRPWLSLWQEAHTLEYKGRYGDRSLAWLAVDAERKFRGLREKKLRQTPPFPMELDQALEKLGPGARSGRLEDYTRAELCKLLGYRQKDAKELTDDDLRAMALDAHLVPRYRGAPSHAELAWQYAEHIGSWRSWEKLFRQRMRKPYKDVANGIRASYRDDGTRDWMAVLADLDRTHPFLARGLQNESEAILHVAQRVGVKTTLDERDRYQVEQAATRTFVTAIDRKYRPAFEALLARSGGGKLSRVVGHATAGTWGQVNTDATRGCTAFYRRADGTIHLSPDLERKLRRAENGKASRREIEDVASTCAHELFHAASNKGEGVTYTSKKSTEHTVEEGETETLARIEADRMAREMGIWDSTELVRDPKDHSGSYDKEVQTMLTLAAAAVGKADMATIEDGGYREPEDVDQAALDLIRTTHLNVPCSARARVYAEAIHARVGGDLDETLRTVQRILALSKSPHTAYRRTRRVSNGNVYMDWAPPLIPFAPALAERMKELLHA